MPAHIREGSAAVRRGGPISAIVGVFGELLITAGVILGLFVVWQLWWTDLEANQEHAQIVASLNDTFAQPADPNKAVTPRTDDPPIMAQPPLATTFATLFVPRFGADYQEPISQGSTDQKINKPQILDKLGISHYPDTQMPGEIGNFAIAGHRTTYGKPFTQIANLQPGDAIVVRTADTWYVYEMTNHEIVYPKDYQVVYPMPDSPSPDVPSDNRYITLTACHPMYSARQRYIVHGTLKYWAPVSEGVPQELLDAGVNVNAALGTDAGGAHLAGGAGSTPLNTLTTGAPAGSATVGGR